jgi:hypothetical protein
MRYCTNCGTLLNDLDKNCPNCNAILKKFEETTERTPIQVVMAAPTQNPAYSLAKYKDNFWISGLRSWGQLLFLLALLAGAGAGYAASRFFSKIEDKIIPFLIAFLPFAIGGFLLVALLLVFVEMASDIGKIRHMLENRKN